MPSASQISLGLGEVIVLISWRTWIYTQYVQFLSALSTVTPCFCVSFRVEFNTQNRFGMRWNICNFIFIYVFIY